MKLGLMVGVYARERGMSTRELAGIIGIKHTALHRLIRGRPVSISNLSKLLTWLLGE